MLSYCSKHYLKSFQILKFFYFLDMNLSKFVEYIINHLGEKNCWIFVYQDVEKILHLSEVALVAAEYVELDNIIDF